MTRIKLAEKPVLKEIAYSWDWQVRRKLSAAAMRDLGRVLRPSQTQHKLIRIGGAGDGGYLVPDDLDDIAACFSPGVANTASFEEAILARDIPCFLADASVDKAPLDDPRITFDPLFLGPKTGGKYISLEDWVARYAPASGDLILQMDIEGAEYDVLAQTSDDVLKRFRILIVEFHRVHRCLNARHHTRIKAVLTRLAEHFVPVHIHPNNARPFVSYAGFDVPRAIEVTFIRKDRVTRITPVEAYPHPLDTANVAGLSDRPLPEWMYKED